MVHRIQLMLRAVVPSQGWRMYLEIAVPLSLCLIFVINIGGNLQQYAMSLVKSDEPSVYSAAYGQVIVKFPTLAGWLASISPDYAFIAWVTLLIAARRFIVHEILLRVALWSSILLFTNDLLQMVYEGRLEAGWLMENVAADFLGGLMLAVIAAGALAIYKFLFALPLPRRARLGLASIVLAIVGLVISGTSYWAWYQLYQPVAAQIEIVAAAPASGEFGVPSLSPKEGKPAEAPFSLLPASYTNAKGLLRAPNGELDATWRPHKGGASRDVEYRLFADCVRGIPEGFPLPPIYGDSILTRDLRLKTDHGAVDATLGGNDGSRYALEASGIGMFWLERDADTRLKITHFISPSDTISVRSRGDTSFFVGLVLSETSGQQVRAARRLLSINDDTGRKRLIFVPTHDIDKSKKLECRGLAVVGEPTPDNTAAVRRILVDAYHIGVLITVRPHSEKGAFAVGDEGDWVLKNGNGWFTVSGYRDSDASGLLGDFGLLAVGGNLKSVRLEEKKIELRRGQGLTAIGDLRGAYLNDGSLRVEGAASQVWGGHQRLSPTKWERLSGAMQIFIITSLITILGALSRLLIPRLRVILHDDVRSWR